MTLVSALLGAATAWLVFRLPGSVFAALGLPALALLLTARRRPDRSTAPLWAFLAAALAASALAILARPPATPPVNILTVTATFAVFSAAVLCTARPERAAAAVMTSLYAAFGVTVLIGLGEVVTGFRLIAVLYPDASTLAVDDRFAVAAFFPNYNDFAVVAAMFALMTLTRLLLRPCARVTAAAHVVAFLVVSALIVLQGSRGALLALVVGSALVVVHALRLTHPRLIQGRAVLIGGLAAALLGLVAWSSPWLQDHSTSVREDIIANTLALMPPTSAPFWVGWGDIAAFQEAASTRFPDALMDPHNIALEAFVWYGLPACLLLAWLWLDVLRRGVWRLTIRPGWTHASAVHLMALMPVLGIVPSSSLRYYYLFVLAACAMAALTPREAR
ncbi:MAG: O-antigen ligase family protein [Arachnia sp.]